MSNTRSQEYDSQIAKMRHEFTSYQYRAELKPWIEEVVELPAHSIASGSRI